MLIERGFSEILDDENSYLDQPLAYFIVQMDKSTWQSYNHATNLFGYNGVPTKRTMLLLEEISDIHGILIMSVCQPSHCFILMDVMLFFILLKRRGCAATLLL